MKKIFKLILTLLLTVSCKSQTPIINIIDDNGKHDIIGAYYKDVNNLLNEFEGTYVYTNGSKYLKLILQKKEMSSRNNQFFEDLIIGEYQFIENGVEKINTLSRLNENYADKNFHSLHGNLMLSYDELCSDCNPNESHLKIGLVESTTKNWAQVDIKKTLVNNQNAIRLIVLWQKRTEIEGQPSQPMESFPGGIYTLIKQP